MTKDPVCGMPVDEGRTPHTMTYRERLYWFCSEGCRAEFLRYPEEYTRDPESENETEDV